MARGRKKGSGGAPKATPTEARKNHSYATAQRWVDEHERHELECQQIMIDAAAKCAPIKAMMSEVKKAAKEDGISAKVFGAILLERKHLRNAAKVRDKLDEEFHDDLDEIRAALTPVADLPIFGAAIEAAEKRSSERKQKSAAAVDELTDDADDEDPRPEFLKQQEQERLNAELITGGIKALDS